MISNNPKYSLQSLDVHLLCTNIIVQSQQSKRFKQIKTIKTKLQLRFLQLKPQNSRSLKL